MACSTTCSEVIPVLQLAAAFTALNADLHAKLWWCRPRQGQAHVHGKSPACARQPLLLWQVGSIRNMEMELSANLRGGLRRRPRRASGKGFCWNLLDVCWKPSFLRQVGIIRNVEVELSAKLRDQREAQTEEGAKLRTWQARLAAARKKLAEGALDGALPHPGRMASMLRGVS